MKQKKFMEVHHYPHKDRKKWRFVTILHISKNETLFIRSKKNLLLIIIKNIISVNNLTFLHCVTWAHEMAINYFSCFILIRNCCAKSGLRHFYKKRKNY